MIPVAFIAQVLACTLMIEVDTGCIFEIKIKDVSFNCMQGLMLSCVQALLTICYHVLEMYKLIA